jgi:uncharacterized protein (DUF1684 family)
MNPSCRRVCQWLASVALAASAIGCSAGPPPVDDGPYVRETMAWRQSKDDMLRTDTASPIPAADRASFKGLPYFDVDPSYRSPATLTEDRSNPPQFIELQTSSTEMQREEKIGTLSFSVHGQTYTLTAFAEEGNLERLFVPFNDQTNGHETYGGGRYLNLDRTSTGLYDLDFNRAYHPYCVYNHTYVCPRPPRENTLPIAIRAGEKLPG